MEYFVFAAAIPGAAEFAVGTGAAVFATLVVALVPVALVVRHSLTARQAAPEAPQLRVIEGGKEVSRRAA